jgi:hypothetical protein
VPLEIRVLVVSGTSAEGLYLDKALRPAEDVFTPFRVDLVQPHRMLTRDILSYAVVALNDVKDLDFGELKMLEKYFEAGGRAFILLGEKADVDFYNRVILPEFQIHARPLVEISSPGFVTIGRVETSHPVLSIFRESRWGDFSTVKFFSYHPLEGLSSQGLAWFTNGQLALAEAPERGIVFAGSPGTSDITKRAVFVPLIHRLFHYLARREEVPTGISTGERFRMSTGKSLRTVKCVTPEGTQIRVVPKVVGGETVITLSDTKQRGIYEVEGDQKALALFPANTDPEESLVAQVNSETLQSLFGAQSLAGTDVIDGQMGLGRYELTKLILWVLLGLVILELLVIHRR